MASVLEQINEIQTKDELIKWLINEYVFLSIKVYGTENEQVLLQELMSLQGKFKKLIMNEEIGAKPCLKSLGETYYVVEVNGKYYKNETVLYSHTEIFQHSVYTDKSLLECKRFYSKEDAQKIANKHGFAVRKVIVKVEE